MQTILKTLLITTIFFLIIATYFHSITALNQDLGRHILLGEIILKTGAVPTTNLFSYTYPDFPFINHHWFSEVIFYLVYKAFNFSGVLFLTALSSIAAFLILYVTALKKGNIFAVSFITFLSLGILYERTDVRPEAFSMLLLSLFLFILFKNREKATKLLYVLIPLELLWTNLHVYFPIGILVIGLFIIDSFCHSWLDQESVRSRIKSGMIIFQQLNNRTMRQFLPLFIVLIASCLVMLINPNGIQGALYPLRIFENYGYSIEENQNLFFLWQYYPKRTIAFFGITVLILFTTLLLRLKHTRPIDWLLAITFTVFGIQAERNVSLFVLAVFLPFSYHLSSLFEPFFPDTSSNIVTKQSSQQSNNRTMKQFLLATCLLSLFIWQLHFVFSTKPPGISVLPGAQKAADFIIANHIKGPFFNNFDIGSYFLFRLYPQEKVFVDGRPEAYPAVFFQNVYIPMQEHPAVFEQIDKQYKFNAIFFAHTDQTPWANQFLKEIIKNPSWKIVYLDDTVIILVKNIPHNNHIPSVNLQTYQPTSSSIQGFYQLLLFFQKVELPSQQIATAKAMLQKNPHDCFALAMLANYYAQTQNPLITLYAMRFEQSCR